MRENKCPLCEAVTSRDVALEGVNNDLVRVVEDGFPSAPGHLLIVPVRCVGRLSDLSLEEHESLFAALRIVTRSSKTRPGLAEGATIGINDGAAAGQTIPHLHLHVIPRRIADVPDARGGIRWVLPKTAAYWQSSKQA